ncbi:MAG: stage II sporulation protein P [Sedimentibacter sp.]
MKKRRKNKGGTKFYMAMSVLCLAILFVGYSYVYNLSEKRKSGQDVTTISINYDADKKLKQENLNVLDKIMSYFNVFLEKTFKDDSVENDSSVIENTDEEPAEIFKTIDSKTMANNDLQIYDDDNSDALQLAEREVYLANNRKEDFFKIIESPTSRSSIPRDFKIDAASVNEKLNIVLYHTHSTEAYFPDNGLNFRSLDEELNVTGIGSRITQNLGKYGLNIIHLTNYNDYPDYNSSYANSNYNVSQILSSSKKNLIIDFHRDGAVENSEYEKVLSEMKTIEIDKKTAATCTLVVGDENGNVEELKKAARIFYGIAEDMYPGLFRDIIIRPGAYFNQYLSDYAMLIEIGSTLNTLEEAQYSADLLSEVLLVYINEINK